jgi:hypothetical protein
MSGFEPPQNGRGFLWIIDLPDISGCKWPDSDDEALK